MNFISFWFWIYATEYILHLPERLLTGYFEHLKYHSMESSQSLPNSSSSSSSV